MNFTLRGFELVNTVKGSEMDFEGIPEIGIYAKKVDYYDGGNPKTIPLTVFSDIRDGEILEVFVTELN